MVSQLCLMCGSTQNCQTLCLGARPRNNLVVDDDVKKPTKQTKKNYVSYSPSPLLHYISPILLNKSCSSMAPLSQRATKLNRLRKPVAYKCTTKIPLSLSVRIVHTEADVIPEELIHIVGHSV